MLKTREENTKDMSVFIKGILDNVLSIVEEQEFYDSRADDSSDEEDLIQDDVFDDTLLTDKDGSFKAHFFGHALLFSNPVQKEYYKKKRKKLAGNKIQIQDKILRNYIHRFLTTLLHQTFCFDDNTNRVVNKEPELLKKLVEDFQTQKSYRNLIQYCMRHKHALFILEPVLIKHKYRLLIPVVKKIAHHISCYIENLPNNLVLKQHEFSSSIDEPQIKFIERMKSKQKQLDRKIASLITFYNCDYWRSDLNIELERVTLGGQYIFKAKNICEMLANIRLSNRSQKRTIKNFLEEKERLDFLSIHRAWQFGTEKEVALELQKISNNGKRSDLAQNMGNYKKVLDYINLFKKQLKINDCDVANWIRKTINGEQIKKLPRYITGKDSLKVKDIILLKNSHRRILVNLSHLLFVVESTRNPGMLIINQMILDLIIQGRLNWEEALTGKKEMPMVLKLATKGARLLNFEYSQDQKMKSMVRKYDYDHPYGNWDSSLSQDIKEKENAIVEKWLKNVEHKSIADHIKNHWYRSLFEIPKKCVMQI